MSQRREGEPGHADPRAAQAAMVSRGGQRIDHIVRGDDAQRRAAFGRALGVPRRRHDQGGLAVARQDDGRGPERFEAAQHQHRIGGLDEMRAVVDGDNRVELVLDHARADGGEAFVESHDSASR